ncbi:MAG TPA: M48 family metalloprotease [Thermoplasmata archaeon]|jgi:Zn-dependent protease with chaperone function
MSNLVEVIGEALVAYWTHPLVLSIVAVVGASMATLLYVFVTNARNAKLRVSLLTGFYALTVFFWLFVAGSIVLCLTQASMVAYSRQGVPRAGAGAVLVAFAASTILSFVVWRRGTRSVLRKLAPGPLADSQRWAQEYADLLSEFEEIPKVPVLLVERDEPLAIALGGREPRILVSRGLLTLLEREEAETVIAHELMHLKHHDAEFKVFSTVFSRILFFDPFSKFFDPAVHREREYLADEMSGRSTGKPAALASALLKIADRGAPPKAAWGLSIVGKGRGVFSRYPPLRERVQRLLLLSDLLTKP